MVEIRRIEYLFRILESRYNVLGSDRIHHCSTVVVLALTTIILLKSQLVKETGDCNFIHGPGQKWR